MSTSARWSLAKRLTRVKGLVDSGVEEGAKLVVDGRNFSMQGYETVSSSAAACSTTSPRTWTSTTQEIFGPVLSVIARQGPMTKRSICRWSHEYGNGTAIFTRDGDTARDFLAHQHRHGRRQCADPGAARLSHLRRLEEIRLRRSQPARPDGFKFYTRTKTVTARWPSGIKEGAEFVIPTMG
jgi:malonate-semialdehyde dehydrogenase (acetylating)/methylmalonate-semialdehyde dehydrogenase